MKLPDRVPLDITVFPFGDMKSAQMYRESRCMSDRDSTIISAFGCYFLCTWAIRYQHELRIYAFFAFPQLAV